MSTPETRTVVQVDKLELSTFPAGQPFRIWLEAAAITGMLTEPEIGRALIQRPHFGRPLPVIRRNPDALVVLGTRPLTDENRGRDRIVQPDEVSAADTAEWGAIVFGEELGIRFDEGEEGGESRGRILWTGQAVLSLEPGEVVQRPQGQ